MEIDEETGPEPKPSKRLRCKTAQPEAARSDSVLQEVGHKREADVSTDALKEQLREALACEAQVLDEQEQEQWVRMENGTDWMPGERVREGDLRELQGLLDDKTFTVVSEEELPEGIRRIGSRLVRRIRGRR